MEFNQDAYEKMAALEVELAYVLRRANDQKLEAAVAAFACVRCARPLLDQYPPSTRAWLADLLVAFLTHANVDEENSRIVRPT